MPVSYSGSKAGYPSPIDTRLGFPNSHLPRETSFELFWVAIFSSTLSLP